MKELVPFIDETVILGGFYTPSVGVVDSLRAGTIMRERGQESGALPVFANTEVLGIDVEGGRVSACAPTAGDVEAEDRRHRVRRVEPEARAHGGGIDPAHAGGAPDDRHRPDALFDDTQGRSSSRSSATWTRTCTSVRTARGLEIGSYAHRPILYEPEDLPRSRRRRSRRPSSLHPGGLRPADGAGARAHAVDRRRRVGRHQIRDQRDPLAHARRDADPRRAPEVEGLWSAPPSG